MNIIKAVIFDMDGVLVDTEVISRRFWYEAIEHFGYEFQKEVFLSMLGRNEEGVKEELKNYYGDDFPVHEVYEYKLNNMLKYLDENIVPTKKGVYEILDYLRENNYKIAVATSTYRSRAIQRLKRVNIHDKFDVMVYGDEVIKSKPNPEIFLKAAKALDIDPKNCLVIEDSPAGVEAAYKGHIKVINVPDLKEPDDYIKKYALKICSDLIEVKEYLNNLR